MYLMTLDRESESKMRLLPGPPSPSLQLSVCSCLHRLPDHDIHSDSFLGTLEVDLLDEFEAHFSVDDGVDVVRALEIACSVLMISLNVPHRVSEVSQRRKK